MSSTTAVLNLGLNTKQFSRGLASAGADLRKFSFGAKAAIASTVAAFAAGTVAIGASLVKMASDANETANKFDAVFKGIGGEADTMAKNLAKNYGLSRNESKKLLSDTGDLLSGFGFSTKSALKFSNQVQELASDLTSFQNFEGGVEGASRAISAALTGETEKMKALGVVIRQGTTEYKNNVKALMQNKGLTELQAKATENLRIIVEQSKNAIGDYAKTSQQLANQLKQIGKIWDDLTIGLGKFLIELLSVENGTRSFVATFRASTNKILDFLSEWQANFKVVIEWLKNSWLTLLLVDFPRAVGQMVKNAILNFTVMVKGIMDIYTILAGWMLAKWIMLWRQDMYNAIIQMIKDAWDAMVQWTEDLWAKMKGIFTGDKSFGEEFGANFVEGFKDATKDELGKTLLESVAKNAKKLRGPLSDFEFTVKDIKFPPKTFDILTDGPLGDKTKGKEDESIQTQQKRLEAVFAPAAEKGSVEAYKIEKNSEGNKTEKEQLKVQKQIVKEQKISNAKEPVQITNVTLKQ